MLAKPRRAGVASRASIRIQTLGRRRRALLRSGWPLNSLAESRLVVLGMAPAGVGIWVLLTGHRSATGHVGHLTLCSLAAHCGQSVWPVRSDTVNCQPFGAADRTALSGSDDVRKSGRGDPHVRRPMPTPKELTSALRAVVQHYAGGPQPTQLGQYCSRPAATTTQITNAKKCELGRLRRMPQILPQ
jgi:hypothetical protein